YHPDSTYGDPFTTLDESFRKDDAFRSSSIFKELDDQWIPKTLFQTYRDERYWVICHGVASFDGSFFWHFILPEHGDIIVFDHINNVVLKKVRLGRFSYNAILIDQHVYFLIQDSNVPIEQAKVGRFPIM